MKKYEYVEHTADLKICSRGKDFPELFSNTALGMMNFIFGEKIICKKNHRSDIVNITSRDRVGGLVYWLSEILYFSLTQRCYYHIFQFHEIADTNIKSIAKGCSLEAVRDIKAVTFHDSEITKKGKFWRATIVYDI